MPSKDRDADPDSATLDVSRDKHARSRSDRKSDKDREHRHHRSSKSSRSKVGGDSGDAQSQLSTKRSRRKDKENKEGDWDGLKERSTSPSELTAGLSNLSLTRQRISLPYPSFSKAHSKEAVHSHENIASKRPSNPPTPEPTDCGREEHRPKSTEPSRKSSTSKKSSRPPSSPETNVSADKKQAESTKSDETERPRSILSAFSRPASRSDERHKSSHKSVSAGSVKSSKHKSNEKLRSSASARPNSAHHSNKLSASSRSSKKQDQGDGETLSLGAQAVSPETPTAFDHSTAPGSGGEDSEFHSKTATPAPSVVPRQPPPRRRPPPVVNPEGVPRVDYLLQNGGLPYPIPRRFISALPQPNAIRPPNPTLVGAETLFAPFFSLLDQYTTVLSKQGSIAVATGHRSVARRLLDRLENVFSRDLPPHGCACVMCDQSHEIHRGLTWGDVLEWASSRIELPDWPPFDLAQIGAKAAETSAEGPPRPASPVNWTRILPRNSENTTCASRKR